MWMSLVSGLTPPHSVWTLQVKVKWSGSPPPTAALPPSEWSSQFPLQPCVFNLYWQTMKYLQGNSTGNYIKSVWLDAAHPSAAVVGGPPQWEARGQIGEWQQSLQRQILLAINNSQLEEAGEGERERRARVSGEKEGETTGEGEEEVARGGACALRPPRMTGRHFDVHLLNVAEMCSVWRPCSARWKPSRTHSSIRGREGTQNTLSQPGRVAVHMHARTQAHAQIRSNFIAS